MGWQPQNAAEWDILSCLERYTDDIPILTEAADKVIELVLGRYCVRGWLRTVVEVTADDVARRLAEDLQQTRMADTAEHSCSFAHKTTGGVAKVYGEQLLVAQLVKCIPAAADECISLLSYQAALECGGIQRVSGSVGDDGIVYCNQAPWAAIEVKASAAGFGYPLRAATKALRQLQATLRHNPALAQGWFVAADFLSHNMLFLVLDRIELLQIEPTQWREFVASSLREADWEGQKP
jgi:hypothetical protein